MGDWFRRAGLLGLAVVFTGLCLVYGAIRVQSAGWEPPADLGITFDSQTLRFDALAPGGAAERAGLKRHDRLLAIDDQPVETHLQVDDAVRRHLPGESIRLKVNLAGLNRPRTYEVVLDAHEGEAPASSLGRAARGLDRGFSLVLIALVGVLVIGSPQRRETWLLLTVAAGAVAAAPLLAFLERVPPNARAFAVGFQVLLGAVGPAALYWLLATFPEESALDRLEPRAKSLWLAAALAVGAPFAAWGARSAGVGLLGSSWAVAGRWATALGWVVALALGGFAVWRALDARSDDVRRRAQILGASALVLGAPIALLWGFAALRGGSFVELPVLPRVTAIAALLVLPLPVGYAVATERTLPPRVLLQRSARSLSVGRLAPLPPVACGALAALLLADVFGIVAAVLVGVALAAGAIWAQRRYRDPIELFLFPRDWEARRSLDALPAALGAAATTDEVVALLARELERVFRPSSVAIYAATGPERLKVQCGAVPRGMEELNLEEPVPGLGGAPLGMLDRVVRIGPDCAAPLAGAGGDGVVGLVVLGARGSDEPYGADDLDRLSLIGAHAGPALERLRAPAGEEPPEA